MVYTESFFTQQLAGRGKKPTVRSVQAAVKDILSARFMTKLFRVTVGQEHGLPRLSYGVDHEALENLTNQRLGRTTLLTDHLDWTAGEVVEAYRCLPPESYDLISIPVNWLRPVFSYCQPY